MQRDMEGEGSVAVTCHACGMFLFLTQHMQNYTCTKCKLITCLEEKLQQLEARLATLKEIRQLELFVDTAQQTIRDAQQGNYQQNSHILEESTTQVQEINPWRNVTHRSRRKQRDNPLDLELQNRFDVLSQPREDQEQQEWLFLDEWPGDASEEEEEANPQMQDGNNFINRTLMSNEDPDCLQVTMQDSEHEKAQGSPQRRRALVIGDSLLRGTEAEICIPDRTAREVCCLPGAKIQDVTESLRSHIQPTDYYPFLLVHVGTNDTARYGLQKIRSDFEALGRKLKEFGAQVVFSSLLPVKGYGPGRERKIVEVNNWLRRWCRRERFGFLDHGLSFLEDGLLARDGLHLTEVGKKVFAASLANLTRRALN